MEKRVPALLAVLLILGAASIVAAPAARQADQPSVAANLAEEPAYVVDRAIMRDAQSGVWRKPTAEETVELVRTLKQLTRRSLEAAQVTTAADGTQKADLAGGFNQVILARPTAEGGTQILCVSTFDEAAEFLGLRVVPKEIQPKREGAQQ
jgi:hypothetical protein